MKERRLSMKSEDLKAKENILKVEKEAVDAANISDDARIEALGTRIRLREKRQREEREKAERERWAKEFRQQQEQREKAGRERRAEELRQQKEQSERWAREAAEAYRKEQEARAAEHRQHEECRRQRLSEEEGRRQHEAHTAFFHSTRGGTHQTHRSICRHDGWWGKVQGRTACPECLDTWTYLLQCPGCEMKACPRCQAILRPRRNRRGPW